jgi:hypothetical protein
MEGSMTQVGGGEASIASCRLRNPTPRSARPVMVSTRCRRGAAEAVEFPDDQGVAGAELVQDLGEGGAVGAGAAGRLDKHPGAAGGCEGVDLELGVLVGGGDAGIAEQVAPARERCTTL